MPPARVAFPRATRRNESRPHETPAFTNKRPPHVGWRPSVRLPLNAGSSQIAASDGSVLTSAFAFWLLARLTSATATKASRAEGEPRYRNATIWIVRPSPTAQSPSPDPSAGQLADVGRPHGQRALLGRALVSALPATREPRVSVASHECDPENRRFRRHWGRRVRRGGEPCAAVTDVGVGR